MKIIKLLFLCFIVVFITSCSSTDNKDVLNFTTDKTLGIVRLNLKSISEKTSAKEILEEKKGKIEKEQKLFLEIAANPKQSGLDIDKPIYVIIDPSNKLDFPDTKVFFTVSDKKKFQENLKQIIQKEVKIDDKNYIYVDNTLVGSIKGDLAVLAQKYERSAYEDSNVKIDAKYFEDFWNRKGTSKSAIKEQVDKSLISDKDISAWINIESVADYLSSGYIQTLSVNRLLIDSGIGFNFNFDKGQMALESSSFFNKELKNEIKKYYKNNDVNYDLVKYINLDNSKSYSLGYFGLDFVKYLIKQAGFESVVNKYLESSNTNLEELSSVFTGDYAVIDYKNSDSTNYYQNNTAIVLGINKDKISILDKLLKKSPLYTKKYSVRDSELLITEDAVLIENFKNKTKAKNPDLKKPSNLLSYSWFDGKEFNNSRATKEIKVVEMVSESKQDNGDIVFKTTFTFDKKDKNIIYYFLKNE